MLSFLSTGHAAACPAADTGGTCIGTCEERLFRGTGTLALVAGSIEVCIGLFIAMSAFVVADAAHALTDAFSDLFGARIARRARIDKKNAERIRKRGSHVIAGALVFGAGVVLTDVALHREPVVAWAMIVAGAIPLSIHLLRWHLFHVGYRRTPTRTRLDLIRHVRADTVNSGSVLVVGIAFMFTGARNAELIDSALGVLLVAFMLREAWRMYTGHGHDHTHSHTH